MEEHRFHLLPNGKRAIVKMIEFCSADKNSGAVLYARDYDVEEGIANQDLLDKKIENWIKQIYPDAHCTSREIIFKEEIDDILRFKEGLREESLPLRLVYLPELEMHEDGERSETEIEIFFFEEELRYPRTYILVSTSDREEYEQLRATYLTLSKYVGILNK